MAGAVALAAGCGGAGGPDYGALQARDLANLPLPARLLEGAARGLELDAERSGYANNRVAADDTLEPNDGPEAIAAAGRITGYNLGYWDGDLSRLASGSGIVEVVTGVDLFRDADRARAFLEREIRDYDRLRGSELEEDVVLVSAETRRAGDLGDGGWIVRATARIAGVTVHGTFAAFTLDRLLGAVAITRADDADESTRAEALARELARRIELAVRGDLHEKPVPFVDADPQTAPPSSELLRQLSLRVDDLPRGAGVFREGVLNNGAFEREFNVEAVTIGTSRLLDLQTRGELADSPAAALERLAETRRLLREPVEAGEAFAAEANRELIAPEVRELGGDATGAAFRIEGVISRGDRYAAVIVIVRVDRAIGSIFAAGRDEELRDRDILELAVRLRSRMATALGVA